MINSTAFNYINVLEKAADASVLRETAISNNIANVDTPGYKRQDVAFETILRKELGSCKHESLDTKMRTLDITELEAQIYTDSPNFSYRIDENNVDIDTETVELASEQIRYEALTNSINSEFERMRTVLN